MKAPKPLDLPTVLRTFEAIPELAGTGAFAGANALYLDQAVAQATHRRSPGRDL